MTDKDKASASGTGLSPEVEPFGLAGSAASIPDAVWLIWASEGEYSDRTEWPIVATTSQAAAEHLVQKLTELWRTIDALWRRQEPDRWDRDLFDTFWAMQPEAVEYTRLTGESGTTLGGCYTDERTYTCCEITVLPAQAIDARSDETTGLGPQGESAVGVTDAPKAQPNPSQHTPENHHDR